MDSEPRQPDRLNGYAPALAVIAAVAVGFFAAWGLGSGQPPVSTDRAAAEQQVAQLRPADTGRAERYRSRSRILAIAALAVEFAVLGFLAFYRGRPVLGLLRWTSRRPVRGAAAIGALLALTLSLAGLPVALLAFDLGRDYGLVTQGTGGWLGDRLLSTGFSMLLASVAAVVAFLVWRRFRNRFWIAAGAVAAGFAVISIWLWPIAVAPLFNHFEPLPDGQARSEVIRLAERAGVDVGEVYSVDASRRSVALNAYVNGLGPSKRVVIYDNAIDQLPPGQFSALIAHELSHVRSHDVYRGLAFALLVIPFAALAMQLFSSAVLKRTGDRRDSPAVVLPLALALAVMTLLLTVPGNRLSREIELHADYEAIELTSDPQALIGLQRRLASTNLSDPDPPAVWQFLFGTHPSTVDRIALAEGMRRNGGSR